MVFADEEIKKRNVVIDSIYDEKCDGSMECVRKGKKFAQIS